MQDVEQFHRLYQAALAQSRFTDLPVSCSFPVAIDFDALHARGLPQLSYGPFSELFAPDFTSKLAPEISPLSVHQFEGMRKAGVDPRERSYTIEIDRYFASAAQATGWHLEHRPFYDDLEGINIRTNLREGAKIFQTVVSDKFHTATAPSQLFSGCPEGFDNDLYVICVLDAVVGGEAFFSWDQTAKEIQAKFGEEKMKQLLEAIKDKRSETMTNHVVIPPLPGFSSAVHFSYIAPHATMCNLVNIPPGLPLPPGVEIRNRIMLRSYLTHAAN